MEPTGIVRRIDELGRIVIPKEIRRTMRLREGEELEILMGEGELVFRKFSVLKNIGDYAEPLSKALADGTNATVAILDNDHVIVASGKEKKQLIGKKVSPALEDALSSRKEKELSAKDLIKIADEQIDGIKKIFLMPIVAGGDMYGCIAALSKTDENLMPLLKLGAKFLEEVCV